ncbi:MAG TPA: sugar porter family MFS transporter [Acidobacteriaceae bacterium]|nr:sugar porter family MFS transporter [Acidobacteriaceae bacterium]
MNNDRTSHQLPSTSDQRLTGFVLRVTLVAALGGLLFGYDTAVISGAIQFLTGHFRLSPAGTGWAASCALAGCVVGSAAAGAVGDVLGRRMVLLLAAVLFLISALGTAMASSFSVFIAFRILAGAGVGAASIASPVYIAEMAPPRWRGWLVGTNQFAIVTGMLLIYFVNYRIVRLGSEAWNEANGWRWMFASGALPALTLLALLMTIPETPRFLLTRGRRAEAARIAGKIGDESISLDDMPETGAETRRKEGLSLLRKPMAGLVLIGLALAVLQQITGINVFLYYAPEIFRALGSGTSTAMLETVVLGAVNLGFTLVAMFTVDRVGRKPLLMIGACGMGGCLIATGIASLRQGYPGWVLAAVLGYIACFALSVGPVTWIVLSEIFPLKIRARSVAAASLALWTANFLVSQTFPMMNSSPLLQHYFHRAFPFFLYAAFCLAEVVFVWKWIPETKNRTLEEIAGTWALQHGEAGSR